MDDEARLARIAMMGTPELLAERKARNGAGLMKNKYPYPTFRQYQHQMISKIAKKLDCHRSKADEIYEMLTTILSTALATGRWVEFPGVGRLSFPCKEPNPPPKKIRKEQKTFYKSRVYFVPDRGLMHQLNDASADPLPPPSPPPSPDVRLRKLPLDPLLLPVHPVRAEDRMLIERWLASRRGELGGEVDTLYITDQAGPTRLWSEKTCSGARKMLVAFARRTSMPLVQIGLSPSDDGSPFSLSNLQKEIREYAADYERRSIPRLRALAESSEFKDSSRGPAVFRTASWSMFRYCATEFYNWLERQRLRPVGTNPLTGMRKTSVMNLNRGRKVVVREWYYKILDYPFLNPFERAFVWILAHGLRRQELCLLRTYHVQHGSDAIKILGKGGKVRIVHLYPEGTAALGAWLNARRFFTSDYLFIDKHGEPLHGMLVWDFVERIVQRVFPRSDEAWIRKKIHPHGFRHFYITDALMRGVPDRVILRQVGHADPRMLERYASYDEEDIKKEILKAAARRPMPIARPTPLISFIDQTLPQSKIISTS